MLTKKILPTRQANSVTVQCKFHIRLENLETNLNVAGRKVSLADCGDRTIKAALQMNYEIIDLIKAADEILEFEVVNIGKVIQGKKLMEL